MFFIVNVYDSNDKLIIESNKLHQIDLNKFTDMISLCNNNLKIEITSHNDNVEIEYELDNDKQQNTPNNSEPNDDNYIDEILQTMEDNEERFHDMTIEPYGKGYILKCPQNHTDYGVKYYHNAWWFPKLNCWFFKKESLEYFLNNGAIFNDVN